MYMYNHLIGLDPRSELYGGGGGADETAPEYECCNMSCSLAVYDIQCTCSCTQSLCVVATLILGSVEPNRPSEEPLMGPG